MSFPGGLPKFAWNVSNQQMRGRILVDGENVPNLRAGIFGNFLVNDGPFEVRFNTGETTNRIL